jgi:hypothetical protein
MKAMFGGDAFSDTFGDLNLWEALTLQLMAATGGTEMSEEEFRTRLQKHAEDRHHKLVEALVKKIASFVRKDIEQFKKEMDADVAEKVSVSMMFYSKSYFFCSFNFRSLLLVALVCLLLSAMLIARLLSNTWIDFWDSETCLQR